MHKFSDFAYSKDNLEGEKVPFPELFGKEIIIKSYRLIRSRVCSDKNCAQIQFSYTENGKNYVSFTSSGVIMTQLAEHKDKMPFLTTICKRRRYFALS